METCPLNRFPASIHSWVIGSAQAFRVHGRKRNSSDSIAAASRTLCGSGDAGEAGQDDLRPRRS